MYHFIYKTTNTVNGKFYIGKHSTPDLDDSYLGSGVILANAIKKYGKAAFHREVLVFCESHQQLSDFEREIITEQVLSDPMCYNLALGGAGGCIVLAEGHHLRQKTCDAIREAKSQPERREAASARAKEGHRTKSIGMYGRSQTDKQKRAVRESMLGKKKHPSAIEKQKKSIAKFYEENASPLLGRTLTPEHRENSINAFRNLYPNGLIGELNPMYGTSHSDETKKLLSDRAKARVKLECPHCSKVVDKSNYARWHGDKCKGNSE